MTRAEIKEAVSNKYKLLKHKDFTNTMESIADMAMFDDLHLDRGKLINIFDTWGDEDGDDFFYDMIRTVEFINQHCVAYTTPDRLIMLNYPLDSKLKDMIPEDGEKWHRWYFIFCHECMHQLWDTFGVGDKIKAKGIQYDHELLNIASDCVINDYLEFIANSHKTAPFFLWNKKSIKEKYGVDYDRSKDTQFDLYMKLLSLPKNQQSQIKDDYKKYQDKLEPKEINKAPKVDDDDGQGPKPPKIEHSKDFKDGFAKCIEDTMTYKPNAKDVDDLVGKIMDNTKEVVSGKNIPSSVKDKDEYIGGYSDCAEQIIKGLTEGITTGGGGGGGESDLPQIPWDNKDNDNSGGGGGSDDSGDDSSSGGGGSSDNNDQDKKSSSLSEAAQKAADAAKDAAQKARAEAHKKAQSHDSDADAAKDAADRAADAAKRAQEAADKAKQAEKAGDTKKAIEHTQEAAAAASEAAKELSDIVSSKSGNSSDKDGDSGQPGEGGEKSNKPGNNSSKSKGKDSQSGDSSDGKSGDGEGGGNSGSKKSNNDVEDAIKAADDAAKAAKEATRQGGTPDKGGDSSSKGKSGGDNTLTPAAGKGDGEINRQKLREENRRYAEQVCKKYSESLTGSLSKFVKKCKISQKVKQGGMLVDTHKGSVNWAQKLTSLCISFVKQKLRHQKEYKRTYKKPRRGGAPFSRADLERGNRVIVKGKEEIKNKVGFSINLYIDISGSMDHCIDAVFKAAYSITDTVIKRFGIEKIVDKSKIEPHVFVFTTSMREIPYGKTCDATGGTYEFDKLLRDIKARGDNAFLNIVISDAGFNGGLSATKVNNTLKEFEGLFIMVFNTTGNKSDFDKIKKEVDNNGKKNFDVIYTDYNFTVQ